MKYTVGSLYNYLISSLSEIYPADETKALANRLLEHCLQITPAQRVLHTHEILLSEKIDVLEEALQKLLQHAPIQYVTGKAYFMDFELYVNESALIPRPETEELVEKIISYCKKKYSGKYLKILDIGAGSGCIPIALKYYLPEAEIISVDISADALTVARKNAQKYNLQIDFRQMDVFADTFALQFADIDIIVSNPPYVCESEKLQMQPNVLEHEPHLALFVPDNDPLKFYRRIARLAKSILKPDGGIWLEINERFAEEMCQLFENEQYADINIFFDFRGKNRFLHAVLSE